MYQLVLGVGWDALKISFQPGYKNSQINWERINQHKILFNKRIGEYYEEKAEKEGYINLYMDYISYIAQYNNRIEVTDAEGTIKEMFGKYFKNKKDEEGAILYGSETEKNSLCSKNNCRYQFDITKGVFKDDQNLLSLYSTNNNTILLPGVKAGKFLKFIRHMVENEPVVNFIDPFIAAQGNSKRFCEIYLSMVDEGASVNVFLAKSEGLENWNILRDAAEERNIKLSIYPCKKKPMHDRFITTSDASLGIGAGLFFFKRDENDGKTLVISEVCNFMYKKKDKSTDLEFEKRLAGGEVESPQ